MCPEYQKWNPTVYLYNGMRRTKGFCTGSRWNLRSFFLQPGKRGQSVMTHRPPPQNKTPTKFDSQLLSFSCPVSFLLCVTQLWEKYNRKWNRHLLQNKARCAICLFCSRGRTKQISPTTQFALSSFLGNPCHSCGKNSADSQRLKMHLLQVQVQLNCHKKVN